MTEMNEAPEGASPPGDEAEPLVKLRGIDKHFGPVQALYGVNLDLPAGQVMAYALIAADVSRELT